MATCDLRVTVNDMDFATKNETSDVGARHAVRVPNTCQQSGFDAVHRDGA